MADIEKVLSEIEKIIYLEQYIRTDKIVMYYDKPEKLFYLYEHSNIPKGKNISLIEAIKIVEEFLDNK